MASMIKYLLLIALPVLTIACNEKLNKEQQEYNLEKENTFRIYSKNVSDTFTISVNLPNDYKEQQSEKYPVVYLLDANLYFDIIATTINKYSDVGLAPSVILVGIGYKDFPTMDSLRNRDDTYPTAIPEYEMSISGGADKFLSFITNELSPKIDKEYNVDTSKRVLMGHSLGGYFTAYAFLQYLTGKARVFNSYIAASPSIHYNKYWLLNQLKEIPSTKSNQKRINFYITYGGLEDAESQRDSSVIKLADLMKQLSTLLSIKKPGFVNFKTDVFSNLDHMDTQLPTFIKGLQWTLNEENR
jgi:predicted alpha/beta superfamily hydrolase